MSTLPRLTTHYAWAVLNGRGPLYDTREDALNHPPGEPASLLKVFAHPDGRIVHTENADEETAL